MLLALQRKYDKTVSWTPFDAFLYELDDEGEPTGRKINDEGNLVEYEYIHSFSRLLRNLFL